ncbi:MAG: ECF transporter S component [Gemmatimonadota bacterium]|nr:ECF transporter S component [Gemmatimonadota bacterium]
MAAVPVRRLTLAALSIALVTLATFVIRIPNPATQGYINLGDGLLFTLALVFGWRIGGLAGGVGSALADALGGYFIWAPWTLVIKGIEGILVGTIAFWGTGGGHDTEGGLDDQGGRGTSDVSDARSAGAAPAAPGGDHPRRIAAFAAVLVGGAWMVTGYYLAGSVLFGGIAALTEIPGNLVQAGVAVVVALPLSVLLRNALKRSDYGPLAPR